MPRETILARTLVELADNLVDDFDVVDILTLLAGRCVEIFDVDAAGLMLADPDGELRVLASSSEAMRMLELFELQAREGPCLDAFRTGEPVADADLSAGGSRWPHFSAEATEAGFRAVNALPMRLRGTLIGALNLFSLAPGEMSAGDLAGAQACADIATIAILQNRAAMESQLLTTQLHYALNSRIVIEQAKGIVAEREALDMEEAFARLRAHARSHNLPLARLAEAVVSGAVANTAFSISEDLSHQPGRSQP